MDMERHFSTLAPHYRSLRTTDLAPILFIKRHLRRLRRILAADIGCGAGRYDLKLCEQLGLKLTSIMGEVKTLAIDHVEKPSEN